MNANEIIDESMSLEEKLAAIDAAMEAGSKEYNRKMGRPLDMPVDPSDLTRCDSCE